ncbi:MAG: ABC transporter ATP-binding protein [Candidatus Methanoplasma sp.]|jgi:iron complex transport system ATP-binding protein|nr:ABC transporter ATP-binding protein [Candidatus Methanoplasma sp.]
MLRAEGVCFRYGKREVLKGVSFEAREGEVLSILGPNGAGKTTLLKCLCRAREPSSGRVTVGGRDLREMSPRELATSVGYVPQSAPAPRMTVYDAVLVGRRPYIDLRVARRDLDAVSAAIDALGLSDLALKYLPEISGGEFQKVMIARAMAQEPKALVLDEPTSSLDISNQHAAMHMALDSARSGGACTVMTMHDINLALHYSDRLLFLRDGEAYACGGPEIVTEDLVYDVYGVEADVIQHEDAPLVVPRRARGMRHGHSHDRPHSAADHVHEGLRE